MSMPAFKNDVAPARPQADQRRRKPSSSTPARCAISSPPISTLGSSISSSSSASTGSSSIVPRACITSPATGRKILDFFGGFCSAAVGHNHPRIIAARQKFQDGNRAMRSAWPSCRSTAALRSQTSPRSRRDSRHGLPRLTGSEAMEAALKVAEQVQGPARSKILHAPRTRSTARPGRAFGHGFDPLPIAVQAGREPGQGALRRHRGRAAGAAELDPSIGIVSVETIQGGGIVEACSASGASCARSATSTTCSGSPTRCSAGSAAPASSSPSSVTYGSRA